MSFIELNKKIDPIRDGLLSVRALNCCKYLDINNLNELEEYAKYNDLYRIRNCGHKTVLELKDALLKYSHNNMISDESTPLSNQYENNKHNTIISQDNSSNINAVLPIEINAHAVNIFDNCVLASNDEVIDCFLHKYQDVNSLLTECFNNNRFFFEFDNTFSIDIIFSSWNLSLSILRHIELYISDNFINEIYEQSTCYFYSKLISLIEDIELHYIDNKISFLFSKLDAAAVLLAQSEYRRLKGCLSVRAQNVLSTNEIDYKEIIRFCDSSTNKSYKFRSCGSKTIIDIKETFSLYLQFLYNLIGLKPEQIRKSVLLNDFPFLDEELVSDILEFYDKNGYYPFFRLVYYYFLNSQERHDIFYNKSNGIASPIMTYSDLSQEYQISRERVRQIVSHYTINEIPNKITQNLNHINYPFLYEDYNSLQNIFDLILESEFNSCEIPFSCDSLIAILSLCKDISLLNCSNQTIILNSDVLKSFDLKSALTDISKTISAKTTENVLLPLNIFISNYTLSSYIDTSRVTLILKSILTDIMRVELDNNYNLIIRQNFINFENDFFNILEENGQPMSFEDLMFGLNVMYPNNKEFNKNSLKVILANSERISCIGKTSTYSLNKWNVCNLTIRGLIFQILSENDSPLSLDEIVLKMGERGRHTNKKNIHSSILSDYKNNFIRFEGGLYGIGTKHYENSYIEVAKSSYSRKSFEERVSDFLNFIDTYHHTPFCSSDENEVSLWRWYYNISLGEIEATPEQLHFLDYELSQRKDYIMTHSEFVFIEKCKDFKFFVSTEYELPSNKTEISLYNWFLKARQEYTNLSDKKKQNIDELTIFLSDYGFYI